MNAKSGVKVASVRKPAFELLLCGWLGEFLPDDGEGVLFSRDRQIIFTELMRFFMVY